MFDGVDNHNQGRSGSFLTSYHTGLLTTTGGKSLDILKAGVCSFHLSGMWCMQFPSIWHVRSGRSSSSEGTINGRLRVASHRHPKPSTTREPSMESCTSTLRHLQAEIGNEVALCDVLSCWTHLGRTILLVSHSPCSYGWMSSPPWTSTSLHIGKI